MDRETVRATALVFAAALVLQVVLLLDDRDNPFRQILVSDARSYAEWAERLAGGGLRAEPTFYQAPLFPLLLAAVPRMAWPALQALLSAAALALLVPVGRLAFGGVAPGVAAAIAAALHGALPFHGLKILPVPLALATQGAALLALLLARARPSPRRALAAGALAGLAALARAEMLLWIPVAAAALWRKGAWLLAGAAALVILPVTLHNAREGGFVPIASSGGDNLFVGNQRGATGAVGALDPRAGDLFSMRALSRKLAEEAEGRPLDPAEVSAHWTRRALHEIGADPAAWLRLLGRKLGRVLHPGDPNDLYSLPLERARYLPTLQPLRLSAWPLLALAACGIVLGVRAATFARSWPALALAACNLAALVLFFVSTRLRLPLLYALAAFAGHALATGVAAYRTERLRVSLAAGALALLVLAGAVLEKPAPRDRLRLASVLSIAGRLEEGLEVLVPCTARDPDALCLDQRGWLLERRGSLVPAAEAYTQALARGLPAGRAPSTHSRLAGVLDRLGRPEDAAREHDAAVADPAGGAGARVERARFRARHGDLSGALDDLRQAERLEPGWPEPARAARELGLSIAR
ncbi:MAG TPA: tetratricopeptide repeat protein [Candidatus Polarisedimenticolaceae bacterium]|nr:tetratricopeptide repeat protein [Candidatus Polarisedimenticolaceae bacterium]